MIKTLKQWFKNLTKPKCPKCRSIDFSKIDEKFIEKKIITKCYERFDKYSEIRRNINIYGTYDTDCYKEKVCVFEVTYKCNNCTYIWNKEIYESSSKC